MTTLDSASCRSTSDWPTTITPGLAERSSTGVTRIRTAPSIPRSRRSIVGPPASATAASSGVIAGTSSAPPVRITLPVRSISWRKTSSRSSRARASTPSRVPLSYAWSAAALRCRRLASIRSSRSARSRRPTKSAAAVSIRTIATPYAAVSRTRIGTRLICRRPHAAGTPAPAPSRRIERRTAGPPSRGDSGRRPRPRWSGARSRGPMRRRAAVRG